MSNPNIIKLSIKISRNFILLLLLSACAKKTVVTPSPELENPVETPTTDVNDVVVDPNKPALDSKTVANDDCFDINSSHPTMKCDEDKMPVCGCNNITYKNACEANKAGVLKYKNGKCVKTANR